MNRRRHVSMCSTEVEASRGVGGVARVDVLVLALAFIAAGCGSATDPRPASWPYVSAAITQPNCATVSCHSPAAAVAGLDFSTAARGFTSLTGLWIWIVDPQGDTSNPASGCKTAAGTIVCERTRRPLVVPFDPAQSRLVHMLRAQNAPRMPPDRPLPEADIRLIESWILAGATAGIDAPPVDAGNAGTVDAPVDAPVAAPVDPPADAQSTDAETGG